MITNLAEYDSIDYDYDPLYRITEQTNLVTNTYTYDNANRLTAVNGVSYTFDSNGNASINSAHRLHSDGQNTYTYDSAREASPKGAIT